MYGSRSLAASSWCNVLRRPLDGDTLVSVGFSPEQEISTIFETLKPRSEGAVLFVDIEAPPMNLLGPELVRDLVSLIREAEADSSIKVLVFKSADPDYFIAHVDVTRIKERTNTIALAPAEDFRRDSALFGQGAGRPEATRRFQAALKHGFQTREAEMDLAGLLGALPDD